MIGIWHDCGRESGLGKNLKFHPVPLADWQAGVVIFAECNSLKKIPTLVWKPSGTARTAIGFTASQSETRVPGRACYNYGTLPKTAATINST